MTEVKTFKIEQKVRGVDGLYKFLLKNINFIEKGTEAVWDDSL